MTPFFGIELALMDGEGKEVNGNDKQGVLVIKKPWFVLGITCMIHTHTHTQTSLCLINSRQMLLFHPGRAWSARFMAITTDS